MITISEAARALGVSPSWLRKAEGQGRLPVAARRFGCRVYDEHDLETIRAVIFVVPEHEKAEVG